MGSISLRQAARALLAGWKEDLPARWQTLLADVEPAFEQVRADLLLRDDEVIYPGRRASPPSGAPGGAHIFKCLDRLAPEDVKAVVIGQDPYPRVGRATG